MWRERIPQPARSVDESRYVGDLSVKQTVQELILHEQDGVVALGDFSGERRFSCRHLAAEEDQFCWLSRVDRQGSPSESLTRDEQERTIVRLTTTCRAQGLVPEPCRPGGFTLELVNL